MCNTDFSHIQTFTMAPASSRIKHPEEYSGKSFSSSSALSNIEALESILTALGRIADLVESSRESTSRIVVDREQRKHFCKTIVDGANGYTNHFNTASIAAQEANRSIEIYTDESSEALKRYRKQLITDLEKPLKDIMKGRNSQHQSSLDLAPYEATLKALMEKIKRVLESWLSKYTSLQVPDSSRRPRSSRSSHSERKPAHKQDKDRPKRKHKKTKEHERRRDDDKGSMCVVM
ncbi:uncharacterized protein K460DRAFT_412548 [Cucurbitaria berberidis CBS 394.84]|uniref:Uncharacterized protein n=1 Tax=Cucurbitaria berberidis CBS 394.84 TaxID=1168544 RepID=A0A9P4GSW6_9PLEO|nr:uncharacterized protein K460DRAFT_412548 [Cucurbitaria berberidis CBS 394.84]KAF1850919.1 hypothetical protein K460DRAFT_412548 [Cucurbitaria berberidis CBS 394.84]